MKVDTRDNSLGNFGTVPWLLPSVLHPDTKFVLLLKKQGLSSYEVPPVIQGVMREMSVSIVWQGLISLQKCSFELSSALNQCSTWLGSIIFRCYGTKPCTAKVVQQHHSNCSVSKVGFITLTGHSLTNYNRLQNSWHTLQNFGIFLMNVAPQLKKITFAKFPPAPPINVDHSFRHCGHFVSGQHCAGGRGGSFT